MSKIQEIKDESLHDGKGVIVHIDNFKWLIEQAEKVEKLEKEIKRLKAPRIPTKPGVSGTPLTK